MEGVPPDFEASVSEILGLSLLLPWLLVVVVGGDFEEALWSRETVVSKEVAASTSGHSESKVRV